MSLRTLPDPLNHIPTFIALIGGHILLALAMRAWGWLAVIYAAALVGWGMWAVIRRREGAFLAALGSIVGAEVLWRITDMAGILAWEMGKYALIALCLAWAVRNWPIKLSPLPIAYFALLLPSAMLTIQRFPDLEEARQQIAFNLAGPCALMCMVVISTNLTVTRDQVWRVFLAVILPLMGIAALMLRRVLLADTPPWEGVLVHLLSLNSNQIATSISLGVVLIWLMMLFGRLNTAQIAVSGVVGLGLVTAILISFTRGGLVLALGAMVASALPLLFSAQHAKRIAVWMGIIAGLLVIVFGVVSAVTQGRLLERYGFTRYSVSSRDVWARDDLEMFAQHPLMGVGPGIGKEYRTMRADIQWPAHTEFTRMLGEHGGFGLISLIMLVWMAWRHYQMAGDAVQRSVIAGLLIWAALYMMHSATRIAAPSFAVGITALTLIKAADQPFFASGANKSSTGIVQPGTAGSASAISLRS